jgi:hypothetical protein
MYDEVIQFRFCLVCLLPENDENEMDHDCGKDTCSKVDE